MTEEELLHQAMLLGEQSPEECTFGELMRLLELGAERERRWLQGLALVAYRHAVLTAQALVGKSLPALAEAFPFWSEEELRQARLAYYRRKMEALAGVKEEKHGTDTGGDQKNKAAAGEDERRAARSG